MIEVHPTEREIVEAMDRIARTSDGAAFYVLLQRRLMALPHENSKGALRSNQGERRFASELIGLMAKGIFESGGRTSSSGDTSAGPGRAEQPIVVPRAEPVSVGSRATRAAARTAAIDAIDIGGHPRGPALKA